MTLIIHVFSVIIGSSGLIYRVSGNVPTIVKSKLQEIQKYEMGVSPYNYFGSYKNN